AFQSVRDALDALQGEGETLKAAVAPEQATKISLDLTLSAQQLGAVNYLAVLSAQQAYRQALLARVQAQAARLSDTVALFQALGGGWWNRPRLDAARTNARSSGHAGGNAAIAATRGERGAAEAALRSVLIIAACLLAGCAQHVVMLNPRTGETTTCGTSPLNPWSQQEACVGEHITQGWRRLE